MDTIGLQMVTKVISDNMNVNIQKYIFESGRNRIVNGRMVIVQKQHTILKD
jgi:hypothetical protein